MVGWINRKKICTAQFISVSCSCSIHFILHCIYNTCMCTGKERKCMLFECLYMHTTRDVFNWMLVLQSIHIDFTKKNERERESLEHIINLIHIQYIWIYKSAKWTKACRHLICKPVSFLPSPQWACTNLCMDQNINATKHTVLYFVAISIYEELNILPH